MATLFIPTAKGGRTSTKVRSGISVYVALRERHFVSAGARFGVERQQGDAWVSVPLSYLVQDSDVLQVALPAQQSTAAEPFVRFVTSLLSQLKLRRKKAPR